LPLFDQRQEPTPKASALHDQRRLRHQERIDVIEIQTRANRHLHESEASCADDVLAAEVVEQLAAEVE
jgi:hypothetical protein